ncbi:hypothetical protein EVAR_41682_1 [Eumeta japonica]|uniref:Uncharacterized protein n=1 Tax=Eumeta variegata TaxID=151549 RepID=A0A4C1VQD2_EUMVA|nr:hypothetical protein EVAR_41682_1 [Eumeta japonica]
MSYVITGGRGREWSLRYDRESVYRAHVVLMREKCKVHGHGPSIKTCETHMCRRMRHLQVAAELSLVTRCTCSNRHILLPCQRPKLASSKSAVSLHVRARLTTGCGAFRGLGVRAEGARPAARGRRLVEHFVGFSL